MGGPGPEHKEGPGRLCAEAERWMPPYRRFRNDDPVFSPLVKPESMAFE